MNATTAPCRIDSARTVAAIIPNRNMAVAFAARAGGRHSRTLFSSSLPGGPWTADSRDDKAVEAGFTQLTRTTFHGGDAYALTMISVEVLACSVAHHHRPLLAIRADAVVVPVSRHAESKWFVEPDALLRMLACSVVPAVEARRGGRKNHRISIHILEMSPSSSASVVSAKWKLFQGWEGFFEGIRGLFISSVSSSEEEEGEAGAVVEVFGHTAAASPEDDDQRQPPSAATVEDGRRGSGRVDTVDADSAEAARGINQVLVLVDGMYAAAKQLTTLTPPLSKEQHPAPDPLAFTIIKTYPGKGAAAIRVTSGVLRLGDDVQFQHGPQHWRVDAIRSLCRCHHGIASVVAGAYCTVALSDSSGGAGNRRTLFAETFNRLTGRYTFRGSTCGSHMGDRSDNRDPAEIQLPALAVTVVVDGSTHAARAVAKALVAASEDAGNGRNASGWWYRVSLVTAEGNRVHATRTSLDARLLPAMRRLLHAASNSHDDTRNAAGATLVKIPLVLEHLRGAAAPVFNGRLAGTGQRRRARLALVVAEPSFTGGVAAAVSCEVEEVWEAGAMLRAAIAEFSGGGGGGGGRQNQQLTTTPPPTRRLTTADVCRGIAKEQSNDACDSSTLQMAAAAAPAEFESAVIAELICRRAPHVLADRCTRVVMKALDERAARRRDCDGELDQHRQAEEPRRAALRGFLRRPPPRREAAKSSGIQGLWRAHLRQVGDEDWAPPALVLMAHTKTLRHGLGAALVVAAKFATGGSFGVTSRMLSLSTLATAAQSWCQGPRSDKAPRKCALLARLTRDAMHASLVFDSAAVRDVNAAVAASRVPLACLARRRQINGHEMAELAEATAAAADPWPAAQRLHHREVRLRAAGPAGVSRREGDSLQAVGVMYRFAAAVADHTLDAMQRNLHASACCARVIKHIVPLLNELQAWASACAAPLLLFPVFDAVQHIAGTPLSSSPSAPQVAAVADAIGVLLGVTATTTTATTSVLSATGALEQNTLPPTPAWLLLDSVAMLTRHPDTVVIALAAKAGDDVHGRERRRNGSWDTLGSIPRTSTLRELLIKLCAYHARYALRLMRRRRGTAPPHASDGVIRMVALFMAPALPT